MTRTSNVALRVGFIGWGALARATAKLLDPSLVQIAAVCIRAGESQYSLPPEACVVTEPGLLTSLELDVVAEAASPDALIDWGLAGLASGADLIVSSVAGLADELVLFKLVAQSRISGYQYVVHPGAICGIDGLAAAKLMGLDAVSHRIIKPPSAWLGTHAEQYLDLGALTDIAEFYTGSARAVALEFPKNANVAMTTALAGIGPDDTLITLVADPTISTNQHQITASGAFGSLSISVENHPLADNPKTSALTALSLARAIGNRSSPIVI